MKFYLHNSTYKKSDIIILGVQDNSGSRAHRKRGVEKGPDYIREISRKLDTFSKTRKVESEQGIIDKKVCDLGNIKKGKVVQKISKIVSDKKIPITLCGDHSITTEILTGISNNYKNVVFVYFDAHPDYRCGAGEYYGSVLCDISKLKQLNFKKSIIIGMRAPEKSEIQNLKKSKLLVITPSDIQNLSIKEIFDKIKKRVKKRKLYISIDMDVIDPSNAPGVETPVPGGLTSAQIIYLIQKLSSLNLIGADVCEVNPKFDIQNQTGHLASRIIAEMIASIK